MSTSVDDVSSYLTSTSGVTQISSDSAMTEADFLTLLSTELENQDPTDPMDNKDLVLQLAQFSTLTSMNTLNTNFESYISTATVQALTSMMGKTVTYTVTDSDGNETSSSGTVDGVNIASDGSVTIDVGGTEVETSAITAIGAASTTSEDE